MPIFLRVGAWYRATSKQIPPDIEITGIIDDPEAQYPISDEISDGGATPTLDEVLAQGAIATEKLAVFKVADDHSGVQIRDLDDSTKVALGVDEDGNGYIEINNVKAAVETAANGTFTTITSITVVNGIITEITGS